MGINTDYILNANVICGTPELIQICKGVEEATLFTRGSTQTGIAVNTMTVYLQVPDVISPVINAGRSCLFKVYRNLSQSLIYHLAHCKQRSETSKMGI